MNLFSKEKVIITLLAAAFILTAFFAALYMSAGKIFELTFNKDKFIQEFNKAYNLELYLEDLNVGATSNLDVLMSVDVLKLKEKSGSELLALENAKIGVRIAPILFGKICFTKIEGSDIHLNLERDKKGILNIDKYFGGKGKFKTDFSNIHIQLGGHTIKFDDKKFDNFLVLKGDYLLLSRSEKKKKVSLSQAGVLSIIQKNTNTESVSAYIMDLSSGLPLSEHLARTGSKVEIKLDNFELKPYLGYIKDLDSSVIDASGVINLAASNTSSKMPIFLEADIKDLFLVFLKAGESSTVKMPKMTKIQGGFDIKGTNFIKFTNFSLTRNEVDILLNGEVRNYKKKPILNVEGVFKNCDIRSVFEFTPEFIKTPRDTIRKVKNYKLSGVLDGSIKLQGDAKRPRIFGSLNAKNLHMDIQENGQHSAKGSFEFDGNSIKVNSKIILPEDQYVDITGESELFGKPKASFNIVSSSNIDAKAAHQLALKMSNIFGFPLGPLPMMKVEGRGELSIATNGAKENATVNGYVNLNNISGTFEGINVLVTGAKGKILFKGQDVIYNDIIAKIANAQTKIDGKASNNGNMEITFNISKLPLSEAIKAGRTSPLIKEQLKALELVKSAQGDGNFVISLKGAVKDMQSLQQKGGSTKDSIKTTFKMEFLDNAILTEPDIQIKNLKGTVDYSDASNLFKIKTSGKTYNSNFDLDGEVEPLKVASENAIRVDLNLNSKEFKLEDYINFLADDLKVPFSPSDLAYMNLAKKLNIAFLLKVNAKGVIPVSDKADKVDLRKVQLDGTATALNSQNSPVKFNSGNAIRLKGQRILFDSLNFYLWGANLICQGSVDKIFERITSNYKITIKNFALSRLNSAQERAVLPDQVQKILADYENFNGNISGVIEIVNNKMGGELSLSAISAFHKPKKALLELKSGDVKLANNKLNLRALNLSFGDMPIYFDAVVSNLNAPNMLLDASFSTNISENMMDALVNQKLTYPIKVKGELLLKGALKGYVDNYNLTSTIVLNPQTDLSYMGANFGDVDSKREIRLNANFKKDSVKIHNASYVKYLYSQNNKQGALPIARASGEILLKDNDLFFNNFAVRTQNPAPASLFNILFKKSILKHGNFSCDLSLNGFAKTPRVLGNLAFSGINIPLYNSEIRDADFTLQGDTISGTLTGRGLDSDIKIVTEIKNSFNLPVVIKKMVIESKRVSLDKIIDELSFISSMQKTPGVAGASNQIVLNPKDLIVLQGVFKADEVNLYKVKAKNLDANFSQGIDAIFRVDELSFDIAGGKILSKGSFEFDKARLNIDSEIVNCDANTLTDALLGISNQIYGRMNGKITLSGNQLHTSKGLETLSAKAQFEVKNGKMPKLGSLEYLLRAGNFVKSGIFGLSLNNIIEVIIPYKTGEFESIKGNLIAENGKVSKLEVYSKGENLSLFAQGTYDLTTHHADIDLLGRLSKSVSNLLGPIGNASLNSIFNVLSGQKKDALARNELIQNINKIPLIEISGEDVRIFAVKILGDLNKEGYVKSFNWVD